MLVEMSIKCPTCGGEFKKIIQYAQKCSACDTYMEICSACLIKGIRKPQRCLICGGAVESSDERLRREHGNNIMY